MRRYSVWPDVRHTTKYAVTPGQTLCLAYGPFSIAIHLSIFYEFIIVGGNAILEKPVARIVPAHMLNTKKNRSGL